MNERERGKAVLNFFERLVYALWNRFWKLVNTK